MPLILSLPWMAPLTMALVATPHVQAATPSFVCSRATTWVEHTICADEKLSAQDMEIASAYARMLRTPDRAKRARVEREQRDWWVARGSCQTAKAPLECLAGAHTRRLAALKQDRDYPGDGPAKGPVIIQESPIKVSGSGWARQLSAYAKAITRCRSDASGQITGVVAAWPEERGDTIAMWLSTEEQFLLCRATKGGDKLLSVRKQESGEALPDGGARLDFRAASPDAKCAPVPVLDAQGKEFGWLVMSRC